MLNQEYKNNNKNINKVYRRSKIPVIRRTLAFAVSSMQGNFIFFYLFIYI